jgi:hypothetical protein
VGNNPVMMVDPSGLSVYKPNSACSREFFLKYQGYNFWNTVMITDPAWRKMMDDWFWESGPSPIYVNSQTDPLNISIRANVGFQKLLQCWVAQNYLKTIVPSGKKHRWVIGSKGFTWEYAYDESEAAGGAAAYDSATQFLGSYDATVHPKKVVGCKLLVDVKVSNLSHWESATRIPSRYGGGYIWPDYPRGGWSCTTKYGYHSIGGNWWNFYRFHVYVDLKQKCELPS